jgi:hypothetical protein
MELIKLPLSPTDFLRLVTAPFFALIILGALLSIPMSYMHAAYCRWRGKPAPRDVFRDRVRLAGGFTVLLFALVVNNGFVSTAATFIGGLLIAGERFLLLLAGILAGGKNAGRIVTQIAKMSAREIKAKLDEDTDDDENDGGNPPPPAGPAPWGGAPAARPRTSASSRDKVKRIEEQVFSILSQHISSDYDLETYATVRQGSRVSSYDALILDRNSGGIQLAIEIKYQRAMSVSRTMQLLSNAKKLVPDGYGLLLVIVFGNHDKEIFEQIGKLTKETTGLRGKLGVAFYLADEDGSLKVLDDYDLVKMIDYTQE